MPAPVRGVEAGLRDAPQGGTTVPEGVGRGQDDQCAHPGPDQAERAELTQKSAAGPQAIPQSHAL